MAYTQLERVCMGAGDTLPELIVRVYNIAAAHPQTALYLGGYTVKLIIRRTPPAPVLIKTGIITDAVNGIVTFGWLETDLVAGAHQPAEIQLIDPHGRTSSYAGIEFMVREAIEP